MLPAPPPVPLPPVPAPPGPVPPVPVPAPTRPRVAPPALPPLSAPPAPSTEASLPPESTKFATSVSSPPHPNKHPTVATAKTPNRITVPRTNKEHEAFIEPPSSHAQRSRADGRRCRH